MCAFKYLAQVIYCTMSTLDRSIVVDRRGINELDPLPLVSPPDEYICFVFYIVATKIIYLSKNAFRIVPGLDLSSAIDRG